MDFSVSFSSCLHQAGVANEFHLGHNHRALPANMRRAANHPNEGFGVYSESVDPRTSGNCDISNG